MAAVNPSSATTAARDRTWIMVPLVAFIVTRLVVFGAFPLNAVLLQTARIDDPARQATFLRWDAGWYSAIVNEGYGFRWEQQRAVAFFPLYPMLMASVKPLTGDAVNAGLIVSNVCFLAALIMLYQLASQQTNPRAASRTVFYIAAFPTAFYFSAAYSESLFLLCTVGAAYAAHRRAWGWAGLCGILATAARGPGIFIWPVLVLQVLIAHGWSWRALRENKRLPINRDLLIALLTVSLTPLGLMLFMAYLASAFGDPLAFWTAQRDWGFTGIGVPAVIVQDITLMLNGTQSGYTWLNIAAFFWVLAASVGIWRRLGAPWAIYTVASVWLPMSSRTESMLRYVLVVFPAFMLLGVWVQRAWQDMLLRVVMLIGLGLFTTVFLAGFFVA